jgi:hypothetical protein
MLNELAGLKIAHTVRTILAQIGQRHESARTMLALMALPTPADVKALPFSASLAATFASIADAKIQTLIDEVAKLFGSEEVKRHSQRDQAVLLGAAHSLYLALQAEGVIGGGGGGGGGAVLSSVTLQGVGTKSWAVSAFEPEQLSDWLLTPSPWLSRLKAILDTFPPGIITAQWPAGGPPV